LLQQYKKDQVNEVWLNGSWYRWGMYGDDHIYHHQISARDVQPPLRERKDFAKCIPPMDTWLDDEHNVVLRSDVPVGGRVVMEAMIKVPC